ncbi:uncharacterized protein LOC110697345 [Chenopodium quinoa]|uniref:uncharacterized protein LOC110697345 n=1 Tax=Chenopodium quinoa TaxID=63459 RepID=UPI000B794335|nr:uncharacterized protein LOC110697345 [Chenopodium quinoa]
MDRGWIYGRRDTLDFFNGVQEFCESASQYQIKTGVNDLYCPCVNCNNVTMVDSVDTIRDHVVCHGFRPQYHVWVWHGEHGSYRENVVGNDTHDNKAEIRAEDDYGSDGGGDGDGDEDGDEIKDNGGDHLDEMMHNVEGEFGDRCDVFEWLSEAAKKPLYPGSKKYTKLSAVLTLFNIKSKYNWSDTSFTSLLFVLCDMLPDENELPKSVGGMSTLWSVALQAKELQCWQPEHDIDVFLEPLVDDLRKMWDEGVSVYDAHKNEMFLMRASLMWTINDFPAYGNLSGYKNKGHKSCPVCIDDTPNVYLEHYGKDVYVRTRRLLRRDHPYRRQKKAFNGKVEEGVAPRPLSGHEVYGRVKGIPTFFGKTSKPLDPHALFKKESIFWKLEYWKEHDIRHCLDVMHIEKNVCDVVVGTIMGIHGKTKNGKSARLDLEAWGVRPELWVQPKEGKTMVMEKVREDGGNKRKGERKGKGIGVSKKKDEKVYLPSACYTLSKDKKRKLCACLYDIKVPYGFSSNMKRFVSLNGELKLTSMKSHDCHMMMQQSARSFYT